MRISAASPIASAVSRWRREQRARSHFSVRPARFLESDEWSLASGPLVHRTGGFFSVVGVRTRGTSAVPSREQPFLLQPEVGILGLLIRRHHDDVEVLLQAKTEPGNPGGVQLAPSFQCTQSNYRGLHGGTPAPYLEEFADPLGEVVVDTQQSEQGTRFLDKYNRNVVVRIADGEEPRGPAWRWLSMTALRASITSDLLLNTDARSVLAVCPWEALCAHGEPFAVRAGRDAFAEALLHSYRAPVPQARVRAIEHWLAGRQRLSGVAFDVVPLSRLAGYRWTDAALSPEDGRGIGIGYFHIQARDREVAQWHQPLVMASGRGSILLIAQRHEGLLRFLLQAAAEIGYANGAQLAPGGMCAPGEGARSDSLLRWFESAPRGAETVVDSVVSEEGGRFFRELNRYRIALVPPDAEVPTEARHVWLSLGEITALKTSRGMLTNECRSALSMLLRFVE